MTVAHTNALAPSVVAALPSIPPIVTTRVGFKIDTTGDGWQLPTQLGGHFIDWTTYPVHAGLLAVIKAYVAFLLESKSEGHAMVTAKSLRYADLDKIWVPWINDGKIELSDLLASKVDLEGRFPGVGRKYWGYVRRMYIWAAEMGVPGFSKQVMYKLSLFKGRKTPSHATRELLAPGQASSAVSKNRKRYDDLTTANIEAALLKAIRDLRDGTASPAIKLSGIVMTYLALDHGQRPLSLVKIRESHFEVRETDGAICYWLEMPECKGAGRRNYIYATRWKQLSPTWGGLIGDLIAQNREIRASLGQDNSLDWPLFPITPTYGTRQLIKRAIVPHDDPVMSLHMGSRNLDLHLKRFFRALQVRDSQGQVIVPTFYSFRDTFDSNMARMGAPLEVRAYELGQTTTQSTPVYDKRGPEFAAMLDQPFLKDRLTALARPFVEGARFSESKDEGPEVPFINPETGLYLGATGRCGCPGSPCGLSGTLECYICGNFRAIVDGPHERALDFMLDQRKKMVAQGKPESQFTRYDIHIFVVQEILRRMHQTGKDGQ